MKKIFDPKFNQNLQEKIEAKCYEAINKNQGSKSTTKEDKDKVK